MFAGLHVSSVASEVPDQPLHEAFERYLSAQREALNLYRESPFFDSDQAMADAYRGVLQYTIGSIKAGALASHDHPRFARFVDWTSKAGLDNPDNNYYSGVGAMLALLAGTLAFVSARSVVTVFERSKVYEEAVS